MGPGRRLSGKIRQIVGKNPVILVGTKIDSRLVLEVCEFEGVQVCAALIALMLSQEENAKTEKRL